VKIALEIVGAVLASNFESVTLILVVIFTIQMMQKQAEAKQNK